MNRRRFLSLGAAVAAGGGASFASRSRGRLVMEIEPGTYELERTLTLDRPGSVLVAKGGPVALVPSPGFVAEEVGGRFPLLAVRAPGCRIDGIGLVSGGGVSDLLHARDAPDTDISRCEFSGLTASGWCVLATSGSTGLRVSKSRFHDFGGTTDYAVNGIGVRNGCHRPRLDDNEFDNSLMPQGIVNYIGVLGDDAYISRNFIRHSPGVDLGTVGGKGIVVLGDGAYISGNKIYDTEGDMIGVDRTRRAIIVANRCENGREGGIEFAGASDCVVSSNVVIGCVNAGLSMGRAWDSNGGVAINDNISKDNGVGGWHGGAGILLRGVFGDTGRVENVAAKGNVLVGNQSPYLVMDHAGVYGPVDWSGNVVM